MIEVTYGFFGEDEGQSLFLREYLLKISVLYPVVFIQHPWYSKQFRGVNNKGVDNGFRAAWLAGFGQAQYKLGCLFIGRDLDSSTPTIWAERVKGFQDKISDVHRTDWMTRTIFMLPMQCIEHWLLALQRRRDGRPSNNTRGLEIILNDAVKKELYDEHARRPSNQTKDELVSELSAELDIIWLVDQSPSFSAFHAQVHRYISSL
ncbi:hypothetical protein [Hymenobacter persicinus]|uniref:DUF4276 family protein n=1 Tax=Hymenobacter persicinus TaxID=2025506 RepID=A0A4Q5LGE4_9BACT|nr:hypothetical protein [Hymenobacter persicinus]RYU84429.1 hypothetical protein EWM57_01700 [Hymenobacter persicinus]